ncbi:MAG TPA: aldehyde dehydrogenase family protein [Polyangiaceae bacterium]|nr:aldehyde dehydrogenase family protein [Polyangiaceae bacterium]
MLNMIEAPSAHAESKASTPRPELDRAVVEVSEQRRAFARLPASEKAALLRSMLPLMVKVGRAWVEAGCRAKGISLDRNIAGEEWLGGPLVTARNTRLLMQSLEQINSKGRPALGHGVRTRSDGRLEIEVLPSGGFDGALYRGLSCVALMDRGVDESSARARQAAFYQKKDSEGGVSLVLGAGNVSSIPASDVLYKMFVDGNVCVLKMNPVNEWVGPFLEQCLAPLITRHFLRLVYGGADVGEYLCQHAGIHDIHITGSDKTHDRIVWGPPGPEQDRRRRENDPILKKTITSELGNVSPVAIVPGQYTDQELDFQARSVVTMIVNNASFNCNAAKMLITSRAWPQRGRFLERIAAALGEVPPRKAYYPGARSRYGDLLGSRSNVKRFGKEEPDTLAWALITDVDSSNADEPLFQIEPFCGILSQTDLDEKDPSAFLAAATKFCNERLWGTLNACIVVDPRTEADPAVTTALDRAIVNLRYGSVAVNHWPALVFGAASAPWGGHPSATLADVQSGLGWVHNTFMLDGIEKSVFRGPCVLSPKPAWFYDNAMMQVIGAKLSEFEAAPSALKLPSLVLASLRG